MTLTDTLDHLLSVFLRPLRTWIEREFIAPLRAAYDAAMQTKEQYRDGVYLHLKERLEGTDEHPLVEGVPVRPLPQTQDLAHLQEAVEMLAGRKIECYETTQVSDGQGIGKTMFDKTWRDSIVKYVDRGEQWDFVGNFNYSMLNAEEIEMSLRNSSGGQVSYMFRGDEFPKLRRICLPEFVQFSYGNGTGMFTSMPKLEEIIMPNATSISTYLNIGLVKGNNPVLRKIVVGKLRQHNSTTDSIFGNSGYFPYGCPNVIHIELAKEQEGALSFCQWSPTMALRTDTTASDYIDLREDKDDSGEFINATNLEQFLANFRKYIILRLANRTGDTALTLTLSAAVYQSIYGLDSSNNADNNSWARTHTLSDLGLTADDLTEAETASGITINTIYATWLDTYRSAINWNIGH